jgi:hypothetical protein
MSQRENFPSLFETVGDYTLFELQKRGVITQLAKKDKLAAPYPFTLMMPPELCTVETHTTFSMSREALYQTGVNKILHAPRPEFTAMNRRRWRVHDWRYFNIERRLA